MEFMAVEHPLVLELDSLRSSLEKYQHAAHTSSLQLQRAHLEATDASTRFKSTEAENARLKHELAILRANPDITPTSLQVSELSLALRRVSDQLSLTEEILLQRTTDLAHASSEKSRLQLEANIALAHMDKARHQEEEARAQVRELEGMYRTAKEETRMADVAVVEYADLVRSLEGRHAKTLSMSSGSNKGSLTDLARHSQESENSAVPLKNGDVQSHHQRDGLVQSLTENRFSLQRLLHEFNSETTSLQTEMTRLHAELSSVRLSLDAERENSIEDRIALARALVEVDRHKVDDAAAGKMVSRYMRFSQSSIDMLQAGLAALKTRHAATLTTLSSSSEALLQSVALERKRASQLRDILDQLAEEMSHATFGRRREIALRLRGLVREETAVEAIGAWIRRAEEMRAKVAMAVPIVDVTRSSYPVLDSPSTEENAALDHMIQDAQSLFAAMSHEDWSAYGIEDKSSSLGRVILAEELSRSFISDLQKETEKKMALVKIMAKEPSFLQVDVPQVIDSSHVSACSLIGEPSPAVSSASFPAREQSPGSGSHTPPPTIESDHGTLNTEPHIIVPTTVPARVLDEGPESSTTPSSPPESTSLASAVQPGDVESSIVPAQSPQHLESVRSTDTLLDALMTVTHRYDELQRAFRNCHLTLAKMKNDIASISLASHTGIPVIQNVLYRLDDFCEDVQVELEIRIANEERIAKGFEALLGVPGALADDNEKARIECELQAFVDGTTPSVVKVSESFTTKLEDLQHDIAQVKRAFHASMEATSEAPASAAHPKSSSGWSSWTAPFISALPSRSSSPPPTFGTVITSPRQRHDSSTPLFSLSTRASSESSPSVSGPYAHMKLRIAMPSQASTILPPRISSSGLQKTSSSPGIYLLGLGSQSGLFSKQEAIAETEAPPSDVRHIDGDSDTQESESDIE